MSKKHKAKPVRKRTAIKTSNSGLQTLEKIIPTFFEEIELGSFIT